MKCYDVTYQSCLEAVCDRVIRFQQFGSYQGAWIAEVVYKGQYGFVVGSYGSCSGCDAIASTNFSIEADKDKCIDQEADPLLVKNFGIELIGTGDRIMSKELALAWARQYEWDIESKEKVNWINGN